MPRADNEEFNETKLIVACRNGNLEYIQDYFIYKQVDSLDKANLTALKNAVMKKVQEIDKSYSKYHLEHIRGNQVGQKKREKLESYTEYSVGRLEKFLRENVIDIDESSIDEAKIQKINKTTGIDQHQAFESFAVDFLNVIIKAIKKRANQQLEHDIKDARSQGNIQRLVELYEVRSGSISLKDITEIEKTLQSKIENIAKDKDIETVQGKREAFEKISGLQLQGKEKQGLENLFKSYQNLDRRDWSYKVGEFIKGIISKILPVGITTKAQVGKRTKDLTNSIVTPHIPNHSSKSSKGKQRH
jgi:hypothetical protein